MFFYLSNTNVPYCSVSPTEWRGPSLLCPSFTSLSQREAATLLLSPFKGLTNYIFKIKTQINIAIFLFLSQFILLSLSEGGCHSPAFLFQRVDQLYFQDKNTNKHCNIFVFISIYTSLSQREAATLQLSPFKGLTNYIYKIKTQTHIQIFLLAATLLLSPF